MHANTSNLKFHASRWGWLAASCFLLALCIGHAGAQNAPAAATDKPLRLTTRGYEVSMDTAAKLFGGATSELHSDKLLAALTSRVARGEASIVKMPVADIPLSGMPSPVVVEGEFSLQTSLRSAKTGGFLRSIAYTLLHPKSQAGGTLVIFSLAGQVSFLGTLPGSSGDKLILVFGHLSQA